MLTSKEYVGGVPVILRLSEKDILSPSDPPAPIAFMLHRTTMLVAILPDALHYFSRYASALSPNTTQVWFSSRARPIPWCYPVGAIKDYVNELAQFESDARHLSRVRQDVDVARPPGNTEGSSIGISSSLGGPVMSQPLELEFRIHQHSKSAPIVNSVPFLVAYDKLSDYLYNEVKQVHKAAYTAIYGTYKNYNNELESVLKPAIDLALDRTFVTENETPHRAAVMALHRDSGGSAALQEAPSPYLLADYQHLLRHVLGKANVAYLVKVGFPFAFQGSISAGNAEVGLFHYHMHRVSAAPPHVDEPTDEPPEVTLGLVLWRLFRLPTLRWKAKNQPEGNADGQRSSPSPDEVLHAVPKCYAELYSSLSVFYSDSPASAVEELELQEPLQTQRFAVPSAWGQWEADMTARFIETYEAAPRGVKFVGSTPSSACYVRFVLQGTEPSLHTPVNFLETHLTSSDRALYVTLRVR